MDRYLLISSVLVFLLSPVKADFGLSAAAVTAAASAVLAGSSLAGTTMLGLMNNGFKVTCGIEIENWSRFPLSDATVKMGSGVVTVPPLTVLPGKREAMVTRKLSDTATGTYGTVSWLVESNPPRRIVVMWSAPYDFNFHSNWMAVGITLPNRTKQPTGNQWFDQMYNYGNGNGLIFTRQKYWNNASPATIMGGQFAVIGTMGTGHKAQIKIVFRPTNVCDTAPQIRALLGETKETKKCK